MEIDKERIQKIIHQMEASEQPFYEACQMLKELINEKWEPKKYHNHWFVKSTGEITYCGEECRSITNISRIYGNEFSTKELAETARDMNKRNQLILQAKCEMGYGDGGYEVGYIYSTQKWKPATGALRNPEITFETYEQAEEIIKLLMLNECPNL